MGHWSESLVDEVAHEVAQRGGGSPDRRLLTDMLARVGRELEILSGRSFHPLRRMTSIFEPNGLPFVDIPDMQVGSMEPVAGAWAIPDPVNRQMAAVLQVASLANPAPTQPPPLRHSGLLASSSPRHRERGACRETTSFTGSAACGPRAAYGTHAPGHGPCRSV